MILNNAEADAWQRTAREREVEIDRLRGVLKAIASMKPSELAPETFPGLVHGPALLLGNCQRLAREALKPKKAG
jgi:hypothetical protein